MKRLIRKQQYIKFFLGLTDSEEVVQLIEINNNWTESVYANVIAEYDKENEVSDNILNSLSNLSTARQELFLHKTTDTLMKNRNVHLIFIAIITTLVILMGITVAIISSNTISDPIRLVMERMDLITKEDLSKVALETKK